MSRLTANMLDLMARMFRSPANTWGDRKEDGRQKQGRLKTLWSLERRKLVRYLRNGETLTDPAILDGEPLNGPGWVLTEDGRKVVLENHCPCEGSYCTDPSCNWPD